MMKHNSAFRTPNSALRRSRTTRSGDFRKQILNDKEITQ